MNEKGRIDLSTMGWRMGTGGRWTPSSFVRVLLAAWLVALSIAIAVPTGDAIAGADDDPAQGAWSSAEAEYNSGTDSSDASASTVESNADPAQGAWSSAEAEYNSGTDSSGASASTADFDADPAQGVSSLAEALFIAGLGGSDATASNAGFAADPAANAWSLAEAESIFVNHGQEGMSGRVYWVPASFCSAC